MSRALFAGGLAAALLLTGCGEAGVSSEAPSPERSTPTVAAEASVAPTPSPTLSPTPTERPEATEAQLASVIARRAPEWREVNDGAMECRIYIASATLDGSSVLTQTKARACMTDERAMTLSARDAFVDLVGLAPPASMEALHDEMLSLTLEVSLADVDGNCEHWEPDDLAEECRDAMGNANAAYERLAPALAAWSPYL